MTAYIKRLAQVVQEHVRLAVGFKCMPWPKTRFYIIKVTPSILIQNLIHSIAISNSNYKRRTKQKQPLIKDKTWNKTERKKEKNSEHEKVEHTKHNRKKKAKEKRTKEKQVKKKSLKTEYRTKNANKKNITVKIKERKGKGKED